MIYIFRLIDRVRLVTTTDDSTGSGFWEVVGRRNRNKRNGDMNQIVTSGLKDADKSVGEVLSTVASHPNALHTRISKTQPRVPTTLPTRNPFDVLTVEEASDAVEEATVISKVCLQPANSLSTEKTAKQQAMVRKPRRKQLKGKKRMQHVLPEILKARLEDAKKGQDIQQLPSSSTGPGDNLVENSKNKARNMLICHIDSLHGIIFRNQATRAPFISSMRLFQRTLKE